MGGSSADYADYAAQDGMPERDKKGISDLRISKLRASSARGYFLKRFGRKPIDLDSDVVES